MKFIRQKMIPRLLFITLGFAFMFAELSADQPHPDLFPKQSPDQIEAEFIKIDPGLNDKILLDKTLLINEVVSAYKLFLKYKFKATLSRHKNNRELCARIDEKKKEMVAKFKESLFSKTDKELKRILESLLKKVSQYPL